MLIGKTTVIYGDVQLGENVILEDGVVIGHPSAAEVDDALNKLHTYTSVEELYHSVSCQPVIIGNNAIIRSGTIIYSGVTIGNRFDCAHHVVIRENCIIGDEVYVKNNTEIMKGVKIGNRCRIAGIVGDNSIIEDGVSSYGSLVHRYARQYTPDMALVPGPTLHNSCIVGRGAVLIEDIHIGENAIVGANTVVNFDVPAGSLAVGVKGQVKERKETAH